MSVAATVLADSADGSLAGLPAGAGGTRIALGTPGADADVHWLDSGREAAEAPGRRVIAPAGEGLWRVAPWPAADPLFELAPAAEGDVIVTGAQTHLRDAVAAGAAARGLEIDVVDTLDADRLGRAACVVIAESPQGALPARAFPVLAAGRLLLVPRLARSFGLEDGLDHLEFAGPDEAVTLLEAHARQPRTFARVRTWARAKARPQRASVVYGRLVGELRREGVA